MHPEIASARVTIGPYDGGTENEIEFSLRVPGVGWGTCTLERVGDLWEVGYLYSQPERVGIGTKITEAMKSYVGHGHFRTNILHETTRRQLRSEIHRAKRTGEPVIIDGDGMNRLSIIGFLKKHEVKVGKIVIEYDPVNYKNDPIGIFLYGEL